MARAVRHLGSGIYSSSKGALNETWDLATPEKMVVADVPINPPIPREEWTTCSETSLDEGVVKPASCLNPVLKLSSKAKLKFTDLPSSNRTQNKKLRVYYDRLINFTHVELEGQQGKLGLCQEKLCCNVTYEFSDYDPNDRYVLAVRSGCRVVGKSNNGLQVCSVLRCNNKTEDGVDSCGRIPDSQPVSRFQKLHISGLFQTKHIYPNIFSTTFSNVPRDLWQFSKQFCQAGSSTTYKARAMLDVTSALGDHPVLVASLYGRMYEWD